jgi:hypothetical protein
MTDDKKNAELHFNRQAIKEAVERMKPELIAASEAAHKAMRTQTRMTQATATSTARCNLII